MRLKIALVITRLDWAGSTEIFENLCKDLDPEIFDLRIIVGKTDHPTSKTKEFLDVFKNQIIYLPYLVRNIHPFKDLIAFLRLYLIFRRAKFDIVHTHTSKAGALGRSAAWLSRKPKIIHTPHGHNFYGYFHPVLSCFVVFIERLLAKITDTIVALTELEKNDYLRFNICQAEKIKVIRQGLELELLQRDLQPKELKKKWGLESIKYVVGLISRLEPVKGIDYFISAAEKLLHWDSNMKFIICGEGSLRKRIQEKITKQNLKHAVIFTGWQEDVDSIICMLDVLVLPSLNEAVGIVLIQAQLRAVPIVATRVGGIPEVMQDGKTGILVSPKDSVALAQAIVEILRHPEKYKAKEEIIKEIREKYSIEKMVGEHIALYESMCKRINFT